MVLVVACKVIITIPLEGQVHHHRTITVDSIHSETPHQVVDSIQAVDLEGNKTKEVVVNKKTHLEVYATFELCLKIN